MNEQELKEMIELLRQSGVEPMPCTQNSPFCVLKQVMLKQVFE